MTDRDGKTALFYAIASRQHHAARKIIEAGGDVFGKGTNSPLRLAFIGTKGDHGAGTFVFLQWVLRYLERQGKQAQIEECLNQEPTALLAVCSRKREQSETVRLLLKYGARPNCSKDGWTPLHQAVVRNHIATVHLLLEHGAEINAVKADGLTPLHLAALNGHSQVVILLLNRGANTTLLCGDLDEERPVWSNKTAADLADIEGAPHTACIIRNWTYWRD